MRHYEAVLVLAHQTTTDQQKELIKGIEEIFSKFEVKILNRHDRGKKELGYPMKKHHEGHVYICDIEAEPSKIRDLVQQLRLEEKLLQVMVTQAKVSQPTQPTQKESVSHGSQS